MKKIETDKIVGITTGIILILLTILLILQLNNLNILPPKYLSLFTFILLLFNILSIIFVFIDKKIFKIIGYTLSVILIIFNLIFCYYIKTTNNFLNNTIVKVNEYTNEYVLITLKDSEITELKNINKIGYYSQIPNINEALEKLKEFSNIKYNDLNKLIADLNNKNINVILLEKNLYEFIFNLDKNLNKDDYKIIYEFSINIKENVTISKYNDKFNIYIGGLDFTGKIYDFNMLVTINEEKSKILLTSIPRDYHIDVYGKNGKDNINYHGMWGITTTMKSLEQLFDTKIDYYIKINTTSLVKLVDMLGGINYCSDYEFVTTHALVLNTYNDNGKKLYVKKGCRNYNGIETLTIARERLNIPGGDMTRQENCRKILMSIMNKIVSFDSITKYNELLDNVSDLYTTNIPKETITEIIKKTLENNNWNIETTEVTGTISKGYVHLSNYIDYINIPNYDSVNETKNKINENLTK